MMKIEKKTQGYFIILIAVFTWSFSEIIVKLTNVGALSLSFFRFFIGGIFILLLLAFKKDLKGIFTILKNNWVLFLLSSCFALGISNVVYFIGIINTQANIGATIYTSYPIWITIYSIFILNERSNLKLKFIGIIIGMTGITILLTNFNISGIISLNNLAGNLLVLTGSIIWGLYSVLGKKIQLDEPDITNCDLKFSLISVFLASLPNFLILIFTPEFNTFLCYSLNDWFWILFLGIICTGLGIALLFMGIKNVEVSKGMSLAFLKPIFATILAFFLLMELPTLSLLVSIPLIILSILLINKGSESDKYSDYYFSNR